MPACRLISSLPSSLPSSSLIPPPQGLPNTLQCSRSIRFLLSTPQRLENETVSPIARKEAESWSLLLLVWSTLSQMPLIPTIIMLLVLLLPVPMLLLLLRPVTMLESSPYSLNSPNTALEPPAPSRPPSQLPHLRGDVTAISVALPLPALLSSILAPPSP